MLIRYPLAGIVAILLASSALATEKEYRIKSIGCFTNYALCYVVTEPDFANHNTSSNCKNGLAAIDLTQPGGKETYAGLLSLYHTKKNAIIESAGCSTVMEHLPAIQYFRAKES